MSRWTAALKLFINGVFADVPLYSASPATHTRGNSPYSTSWPRPAEFTAEINNNSLDYDPERPESALYGTAGRSALAQLYIQGGLRLQAETVSYRADRTPNHRPNTTTGRSSVALVARGTLDRLQDWTDPVKSPMIAAISGRTTKVGHWPLEDSAKAKTLFNTVTSGPAGKIKGGVTLAESEKPAGAARTIAVDATGQISGEFVSVLNFTAWQVAFSFKAPSTMPGAGVFAKIIRFTHMGNWTLLVEYTDTSWRFSAIAYDGTVWWTLSPSYGGQGPQQWVTMRIKVSISAGTVTIEPAWYQQNSTGPVGSSGSFTNAQNFFGALRTWATDPSSVNNGAHYAHIYGCYGTSENLLDYATTGAFDSYRGERAGRRLIRVVTTELGMSSYFTTGADDTPRMGPQPVDSVINILKDIQATDGGRLDDAATAAGFNMRSLHGMRGQTAKLTLTYPTQVAAPFVTDPDNAYLVNNVTVKNRDAGEEQQVLTTGPMSTQMSPAGIGERRGSVDVNLYDEVVDLVGRASWELARGTFQGRQFLNVTVDLDAGTVSAASATAVDVGDYIVVTGYPPEDIHLWVVGIKETIGADRRLITYECESYDHMRVGGWSDGTWRWGLGQTAVSVAANSTTTTITVASPDRNDLMVSAGTLDLMIAGERVTCTAQGAITGSGPYAQDLTVARSVNGVIKGQKVGAAVVPVNARRWGLGI